MTAEMLEAERQWLPQFAGKSLRPTPAIRIPARLQARRRPARPGPGHRQSLRELLERKTGKE